MLEFTVTPQDRVVFQLWVLDRSGRLRRAARQLRWIGYGTILAVSLGLMLASVARPLSVSLAALVGLALWEALVREWPRLVRRRLTRRLEDAARNSGRPRTFRLWLDERGLNVGTDNGGSQHLGWSQLRGVEDTPDHVFLMLGPRKAFIVPKRTDPALVEEFANRVRARCGFPGAMPGPLRPAGPVPLSEFAPVASASVPQSSAPELTYTLTLEDLTETYFALPGARERNDELYRRFWWRRQAIPLTLGFLLLLLTGLVVVQLPFATAILLALVLVGVIALVRWSAMQGALRRATPALVEKSARRHLAQHGDHRRLWADDQGVTMATAAFTLRLPWSQLRLSETERYGFLSWDGGSTTIPKRLGEPAEEFLAFARSRAVGRP